MKHLSSNNPTAQKELVSLQAIEGLAQILDAISKDVSTHQIDVQYDIVNDSLKTFWKCWRFFNFFSGKIQSVKNNDRLLVIQGTLEIIF